MELARELDHPYTLAYTMFHVGVLHLWRREWHLVDERATDAWQVADDYEYQIWRALSLVLGGVVSAGLGRPAELARIDDGIALYEGLRTPPVFWPLVLYVRAAACGLADRPTDGLRLVDEGLGLAGVGIVYPELALLRGDLLLASGDAAAAEASLRDACEVAGVWGLRMSHLRAATRLARMGKSGDSVDVLHGVYRTFSEGFATPDLLLASAVLSDGGVKGG